MAFLYCRNCNWEQDDFWSLDYNPITCWIVKSFGFRYGNWRPHYIEFDDWYAKGMGWKSKRRHSWSLILSDLKLSWTRFRKMKWWTQAAWKRAAVKNNNQWPPCPECGSDEIVVD